MNLRAQKVASLLEEMVQEGVLTAEQLSIATETHKNKGGDIEDTLIQKGLLTEKDFTARFARKLGIANLSLNSYQPDPSVLKLARSDQIARWRFIPLFEVEGKLTVATADPLGLAALDEARQELGRDIECILTSRREINEAIKKYYREKSSKISSQPIEIVHYDKMGTGMVARGQEVDVAVLASKTVALVDELLQRAFLERSSDIHLEPTRDGLKVRIRIDGVLEQLDTIPLSMQPAVLSRVKILGGMDVAEHRIPQDGRTHIKIQGKELDLRIATYPTIFGESAAIRLLSKEDLITLEDLGLLPHDLIILEKLIHKPHGIFLVTGPTGSGKTTTLYAALQKIDRVKNHVLSVEDPVENEIEGVNQTQIHPKAGVTFASALRALLREDPNVIMLGEIRDQETAEIAFRAAMTGHLVLSTLHTNDAIATIARLTDLDVQTYLISSTVLGVMAQRLVRRVCPNCKEESTIPPEFISKFGAKAEGLTKAFHGKGCSECNMRGYKGRVGVFELVPLDDDMRVLISSKAPEVRLRERAAAAGCHTMLEDGIEKIKRGLTTTEEILRVCGEN